MPDYMMISADSHVSEPPNLWVDQGVDSRFKDRAPRLARNSTFRASRGPTSCMRAWSLIRWASGLEWPGSLLKNWPSSCKQERMPMPAPAAGTRKRVCRTWNSTALRLIPALHHLGVPHLFWLKDPALQTECFRVYNDVAGRIPDAATRPSRCWLDLALIPLYDPKAGAKELQRCAEMGLKGRDDMVLATAGAADIAPTCTTPSGLQPTRDEHARQPACHHRRGP